jgi:hypothetical protein
MAGSQVPLENVQGPPEPFEQSRPDENGVAIVPSASAEIAAQIEAAGTADAASRPAPVETAEQAPLHLPELNGSTVSHADALPQLDGEVPQSPIEPEAAPAADVPIAAPAEQAPPPIALEPAPHGEVSPPEAFAAARAEPAEPPQSHVPPPAEVLMEVSPILSALDAAEKAAAEAGRDLHSLDEPVLVPEPPGASGDEEPAPEAPVPVAATQEGEPGHIEPLFENDPPLAAVTEQDAGAGQHADAGAQLRDAASKIAEEAQATAAALESLKRLLDHKLPLLDPVPAPAPPPAIEPAPLLPSSVHPPIPAYQASPRLVIPPPMVPLTPAPQLPMSARSEPARRPSGVGGFLAGFALSWVIGAILYAYLAVIG